MRASWKRTTTFMLAVAALPIMLGLSATPAGARVAATNDKFCNVMSSNQGAGIDFQGLAPPEARFAATLLRKAAKTGVPATLKADLARMAKLYDRIAAGESAAKVLDAAQQKTLLPALTRFGKYLAANCVATPT
jgi:hypothetical protein